MDWQNKPSTGPAYSVWTEAADAVAAVVVAAAAVAVAVAAVAVAAVAVAALFADPNVQGQPAEDSNLEPFVVSSYMYIWDICILD